MPFMTTLLVGTAATASAPATAGIIGAGGAVTAGGVATTAAVVGGTTMAVQSSRAQAKSESALNKYNAQVADQEAKARQAAGAVEARERRDMYRRLISSQRAGTAKSGVTTEGSPIAVMSHQAEIGELDALMTSYNAGIGASRAASEGIGYRYKAKSAKTAGKLNVGGSLFTGGATIGGRVA